MIKVLDSFIADKIAAGEVIERPVSAIKELIENSIDAGASSIIVEIRNGGKSYIRVTDDGCGIPYDEAETAFLRHATSKISSITDLDSISSLGFRGEALASISAVSRLTMVSKTDDSAAGIKLVLHGGKVISSESIGANRGTTIIAEDLFYNTPARRKFMKSDAREASAVIELVQQFAVCYTDIRFMMISNGNTLFSTAGDGNVLSVIKMLYPETASAKLLRVEGESVEGYVSDPGSTRTSRKGQLFFVNGRIVSSSIIEKALTDGYNGRIFSGHPAAVLFITADPHDIDVNIHPGKREIRFLRQDEVASRISSAVSDAVMSEEGVPEGFVKNLEKSVPEEDTVIQKEVPAETNDPGEQTSIRDYLEVLERPAYEPTGLSVSETHEEYEAHVQPAVRRQIDFDSLVFKGYLFDTYVIMQSSDTAYVFDQHAAHERVFYERFMEAYRNGSHVPQPVLTPFTVNVSADVYNMERDWMQTVAGMGYDIEDFGGNSFVVRGIPAYMSPGEADLFIRGLLEVLDDPDIRGDAVEDKLIMRSCKSAVKGGEKLSEKEIEDLMSSLSQCANPYSCPHGRPTFIKLTKYDIERTFRRR